ncbi:CBS domain-containing protein [Saezia sanguinis]|jgi:CBS domain-containing protein|uniref:CBS domain-containing protein n=1 Tax=Saezia sanguinis TaxID=1965230 RepID=UPI003026F14B
MNVSDILRIKGQGLFTVTPDDPLQHAAAVMAQNQIGSLVVVSHGAVVGLLTFRELIKALTEHPEQWSHMQVRTVMDDAPLTCTPQTSMDEIERVIISGNYARYMPVMEKDQLVGLISLYDVAKAVLEAKDFENSLLKAYIKTWPEEG